MKSNVNILTTASRISNNFNIIDYENLTYKHVVSDWGHHNQIKFHKIPYTQFNTGHTIANCYLLRILLTGINNDGTGDAAFVAPAILTNDETSVSEPPYIIQHPADVTAKVNQRVVLTVKALSVSPLSYQWKKNGSNIAGAIEKDYVINQATKADQALYSVEISNAYSSVTSNSARLIVTD